MKNFLDDTSDLLRKKRAAPSSSLAVWKLRNKLRKEQVLFEPSLTDAIQDTAARASSDSSNGHIRGIENTSYSSPIPDAVPETGVRTPASVPEFAQESRIDASPALVSDLLTSPPRMPSPRTGVLSTPDFGASTSAFNTESGTAGMSLDDIFDMDCRPSAIPETRNDADAEHLYFPEPDCTPPGSQHKVVKVLMP